ncbi:peptidyl-tRNA hydrolase Pth2 [Ignisphaera sp. 4213-co]|uniref:Peptidyl-tRNA hydrolase n=1 Tax=Ignisphaera cupida TaxID=3050454 RepID=A0ABD4Z3A6_9CREN|nr:peptidyl-tRNA hydrolase Pth2 [Ignisphaera sp. 4213-co]MDK6027796.1 peptidyl-tRNA hydrolase Pth2 [Ignisphaera sp. 4213-co]
MIEVKQVIVVRTDIKMGKGKLATQVAHAAVEAVFQCLEKKTCVDMLNVWRRQGQKKIVVKVKSLEELLQIKKMAEEMGINTVIIADAGLTQLEPGTITALGLGPAPAELIDKITGNLPLL